MSVIQRASNSDFVSCVLLAVEVVYIFIVIHALTMVAVRSKALAIYFFFVILCLSISSFISRTSSFVFFFVGLFSFILSTAPFFLHNFHTAAKYAVLPFIKPVSNYLFQVSLPKVTLGILLCQEVFFNFKVIRFFSWI